MMTMMITVVQDIKEVEVLEVVQKAADQDEVLVVENLVVPVLVLIGKGLT